MRYALLCVVLMLLPSLARANGRFPAANQLVRRPASTKEYVLRTTFGMLLSNDGAKTWDWVCEQAYGFNGSTDAPIAYSSGGSILVGTFFGVSVAQSGNACQWDAIGTVPAKFIRDVTVRRDRPGRALALLSANASPNQYDCRLFESVDDGLTFQPSYVLEPTLIADSVDTGGVANPTRVYVTAFRVNGSMYAHVLLVSDDDGKTFVERPIPTDPTKENGIFIAAVDPTSADRVYLRTTGSSRDDAGSVSPYNRLFVSEDAGQSFKVIFTAKASDQLSEQALLGFALSDDGSKIYVGGPADGVNVAARADFQFKHTSDLQTQCLAVFDGVLWACGRIGFALGTSTDDGASFTPVFSLDQIRGPLSCPPASSFNTNGAGGCLTVWPPIRDTLGVDAGASMMIDGGKPGATGCGCTTPDAPAAGWLAAGLAVVAGAILGARKMRR